MPKLSIYVETSVWSHAFADDAPDSREATLKFLDAARQGKYDLFVSEVVFEEVLRAPTELAARLRELVQELAPVSLDFDEDSFRLAQEFLQHGVVSPSSIDDARHVAVAVVSELDVLVSWNYRHLVNVRRREKFHQISVMTGYYKPLHIVTPPEVDDESE
jgi:predicted nucleic acid-binding protein